MEGKHLKNLRKCFQFPVEMKVHLPRPGEKACAFAHCHVCFYEANFLYGLRFPIHPFIHKLLNHFKIALGQPIPNAWQTVVSVISICMSIHEGSMVSLNEFLYLYYLKPSTHYGHFEFHLWIGNLGSFAVSPLHFSTRSLSSSLSIGRDGKLLLTRFGVRCLHCRVHRMFPHLVRLPIF